ncbi:thioredoxin TrxA [Clostridium aciditolerans]|uniref:Thioredoxin n=1 Tax=Clostridium aciditolerans TaxID=339861 RepID=A0A934HWT4_9CLOT|nr:thioredoxin domain-containing protein [Clostridium aciditolerans]MBI6872228.1 thioredoxin [Clostridium aciditolerans]
MIIVDKDSFNSEVLEGEGYVLVDYFGDGCAPCQALLPDVEALAEKYEGKVKFCKLNTTKARRLAISQKVLGLPTISLYKDGKKIEEVVKEDATKESIDAMITKHINA